MSALPEDHRCHCGEYGTFSSDHGRTWHCAAHNPQREQDAERRVAVQEEYARQQRARAAGLCPSCDGKGCPWCQPERYGASAAPTHNAPIYPAPAAPADIKARGNNSNSEEVCMTKRNLDAAFPSRYLRSPDVEGRRFTATVKSVEYEKMADGKEKPVAYFKGMKKGVVLNKTKASFLAQLAKSRSFDDWIGTSIDICGGTTQLRGDTVSCIVFEKTKSQKAQEVKDALDDDLPDNLKGSTDDEDDNEDDDEDL